MSSVSDHYSMGWTRSAGIIDRPRLLEKLQAVLTHKLTLISAPPGYGKTTMAAQFAQQAPRPVAWHAVEERERDLPNLWMKCLAALGPAVPGIQSLSSPFGYSPDELAALAAHYLRDTLHEDIVYILDDVQHLTGATAAERWLQVFVQLVPQTCHLVLISRMLPDLPLAEMIARREVLAIGQNDLRFTPQEIQRLAHAMLGVDLPSTRLSELSTRLEGWPAGVVLALQPLPADLERAMLSGGEGPEALFNALAGMMLHAQPPALRHFLLASSTLSHLTPERCANALRLSNTSGWLAEAQSRNLFLTQVPGGLMYHRLFRSFLQNELKRSDPGLYMELHIRAARWFEAEDDIDEAFDHYMEAGLVQRAAALAERATPAYFALGKVESLLEWSSRLNGAGVGVPVLYLTCAKIHTDRYEYEAAESALTVAEKGFTQAENSSGLVDVNLQRAMINLQQGEYRKAAFRASQMLDRATESGTLRGRALNILGFARLRLGQVEEAVEYLEAAVPLHRAEGNAYALSHLLQNLEIAYTRLGRVEEAVACLQEVVALRRALRSAGPLALALNNLGYYYHQHSNYQEAMSTLQEGLSIASRAPDRKAESYLLWSLGDLQRDRGAFDDAMRAYDKALNLAANSDPSLRSAILISASTLRRWQGNLPEAIRLAEEALALASAHDIALEATMARAANWAARAQLGQTAKARIHLEAVAADLRRQNVLIESIQVLGLCAGAALQADETTAAERHLDAALQAAGALSSVHPLAVEVIRAPKLEAFVLRHKARYGALLTGVEQLQQAQIAVPGLRRVSQKTAVAVTYTLRVLTLGQIAIERDGERIPASEWRATKARDLFLYLLFFGEQEREQLGLFLWPESSTRKLRSNFHTTLYRIRRALGENVIAFSDGMYGLNPDVAIWCDAIELEKLADQARLLSPRDARTEDLWRRAVDLYKGDFLPALDAEWASPRRETLQEIYLEAVVGLGECIQARGDFRAAIDTYRKAFPLDPYREDVHRAIMICYGHLGEKRQILMHLQDLEDLLARDLGIKPSDETLRLAARLLK